MVTFTIDGKIVEAEEGKTVLQVARENNIEIPTLCYHEALEPYGACRLCLVEIIAGERKRLVTACTYPVEPNIEVSTNSEEVIEARKMSVELLLARCPKVEVIQNLAKDFGIEKPRFKLEDDDCILCGLCVRICEERMGVSAISLAGRGINVKVDTPFHIQSDVCIACGACAFICPTGAIKLEDITNHKPIPIPSEFNMGLSSRTPIYIPYPQAVPNIPVIDRENCVYFLTGECKTCEAFCPTGAIKYDQEDELVELNVASVILAPGYETVPAAAVGEYGYGRYENVITSREFERYLSASGPTSGGVIRPGDNKPPKRIAFIQCVGSRDFTSKTTEYCCSVGCMYAIKEAVIAQEHLPGVKITIFFIDMRTHGKGYENYYVRAEKEYGVRCIRSSVSSVREMKQTKNLRLRYIDETGTNQDEDFDLVVLTVGIQCPSEFGLLSDAVGLARNEYGFCQTDIFSPTNTTRDGIFVCGVIQEPKDIPDSVVQASAAAASAGELIANGRGAMISEKEYPPERGVFNETPRVGVFVCHCGHNIASVVNVEDSANFASKLNNVAHAEDVMFTCSPDGLDKIKKAIFEKGLNRVVVASCSPRTHEPLFKETLREAGLNRYLFEMANIRDQCSWVHAFDHDAATDKAKRLIRSAVAKARLLEPLEQTLLPNTQVALVIGGGLAGMEAALSIAKQGFPVHIVEKTDALGGNARHVRYTLEGGDVQPYLSQLIEEVENHPLIDVHLSSEVVESTGFIGNFSTKIATSANGNGGELRQQLIEHGVIILATGAKEYEPKEYRFGESENIITQRELENRIADDKLQLDENATVVMIQCVGCRNEERTYCSRICCSEAIKNALKIKEAHPDAKVYVLYKDIRTFGFREKYYQQAREKGVIFIRYDDEHKPVAEVARLQVKVHDPVLNEESLLAPNLIVLSTAIISGEDNEKINKLLMVPRTEDGFFLEAHIKLRPVDFASDGMFLCGLAHGPKFISESIVQAKAAASRAATILWKSKLLIEGIVSVVDDEKCVACLTCVRVCPFQSPKFNEEKGVVEIEPATCHGCGICVSECPAKALQLNQFNDKYTLEMIDALLME